MKRILIIGNAGAGKTTFAHKLALKLNLPLVHLDKLYWRDNWQHLSKDEFDCLLQKELEKPEWIIDGNFNRTIPQVERLSHIGSTVIGSIWAKPIIDILAEVPKECNLSSIRDLLMENGYICMNQNADRVSFNKGYTENGFAERVFHLHLRYCGDNDELYFRDYLIEHPDIASEYEAMKLKLWKKYEHNRDGYTNAKTEFVQKYTEMAKAVYGNRYR